MFVWCFWRRIKNLTKPHQMFICGVLSGFFMSPAQSEHTQMISRGVHICSPVSIFVLWRARKYYTGVRQRYIIKLKLCASACGTAASGVSSCAKVIKRALQDGKAAETGQISRWALPNLFASAPALLGARPKWWDFALFFWRRRRQFCDVAGCQKSDTSSDAKQTENSKL